MSPMMGFVLNVACLFLFTGLCAVSHFCLHRWEETKGPRLVSWWWRGFFATMLTSLAVVGSLMFLTFYRPQDELGLALYLCSIVLYPLASLPIGERLGKRWYDRILRIRAAKSTVV